jgi:hypothetical protein
MPVNLQRKLRLIRHPAGSRCRRQAMSPGGQRDNPRHEEKAVTAYSLLFEGVRLMAESIERA